MAQVDETFLMEYNAEKYSTANGRTVNNLAAQAKTKSANIA